MGPSPARSVREARAGVSELAFLPCGPREGTAPEQRAHVRRGLPAALWLAWTHRGCPGCLFVPRLFPRQAACGHWKGEGTEGLLSPVWQQAWSSLGPVYRTELSTTGRGFSCPLGCTGAPQSRALLALRPRTCLWLCSRPVCVCPALRRGRGDRRAGFGNEGNQGELGLN